MLKIAFEKLKKGPSVVIVSIYFENSTENASLLLGSFFSVIKLFIITFIYWAKISPPYAANK